MVFMKKNLLVLLFFAFVMQAKAGVLIEPYVGYAMNGSIEVDVPGADEEDYSGTTLGGRLGYQFLGLFGGIDYRLSNYDVDGDELTESQYGIMVGYDFPILVRVWGEYILGGEGELDSTGSPKLKDPSGTILGVGFTGLPFVSLNLEMANYQYGEYDGALIDSGVDTDMSHILLSVSLPLNL